MATLELTRIGYVDVDGLEGEIGPVRYAGQPMTLLFGESHPHLQTHDQKTVVRRNLLNAVRLIDAGWIHCVFVEEATSEVEVDPSEGDKPADSDLIDSEAQSPAYFDSAEH